MPTMQSLIRNGLRCALFAATGLALVLSSAAQPCGADDGQPGSATRVPDWAADAVFYQLFPERFRNGDPSNDPDRDSLEFPDSVPANWRLTPWTREWYARDDWEQASGDNFYENGVFNRRLGGDLQGVLDKLDYLQELGINCIYFNPVFYARSLHKYDGNSFHHIDPHFGPDPQGDFAMMNRETADPLTWNWTAADRLFLRLIEEAHRRGIRVIIDGVFNHTGRDFFAFADLRKNQQASPYVDWYVVKSFDDPQTPENEFRYQCWWGVETLPEFADTAAGDDLHPAPKAYVMQATRRWMDPDGDGDPRDGIDGWRLDVANEVPNAFWREWNAVVREINPEAYTVAEIWDEAGDYLADCGFSSTMNYHGFAFLCKAMLVDGRMSGREFSHQLVERMERHPRDVRFALMNMLDSHDTDRVASMIVNAKYNRPYQNPSRADYDLGERVGPRNFREYDVSRMNESEKRILRLAAMFQMSFVGAPMVYYGTEAGMDGGDDPDDRMPMIWDDLTYEPRRLGPWGPLASKQRIEFDRSLFEFYRDLVGLRTKHVALRRGEFRVLAASDTEPVMVFERHHDEEHLLIAVNRSNQPMELSFPRPDSMAAARPEFAVLMNSHRQSPAKLRIDGKQEIRIRIPPVTATVWRVER